MSKKKSSITAFNSAKASSISRRIKPMIAVLKVVPSNNTAIPAKYGPKRQYDYKGKVSTKTFRKSIPQIQIQG